MKILFLHGWQSTPGGIKPTYLKDHGHEVLNPALPDDDFDAAVRIAQAEFDQHHPDVVVGSSRGGAVAMNINAGSTPLVLLCPAWKRWGTVRTVKPGTVILHSEADEIVPLFDSVELLCNSGLPPESLIEVGTEHRLADPESLAKMVEAVERVSVVQPSQITREAGVPRHPGVGTWLVIATMYAVLFALLRVVDTPSMGFAVAVVFVTAICLGQAFLFNGQHPRRASMIAGACCLSCCVLVSNLVHPNVAFN